MDMSAKLNLSYPATRPTEQVVDKPVERLADTSGRGKMPALEAVDEVDEVEKVKSAVAEIERFLSSSRRNLEFSMDEESGKIVVKVIASETGELIRQLPSKEALQMASSLRDVNSILFNAKV
ncbi:flagellar protein FlaG [Pseudomonas putida]